MAANMYRVGDYVYFETSSTSPFQIRRIEELNKTPNGNVEAKVMCFYRRRDISSSLIMLADKHQSALEEDQEGEPESFSEKQRHQLKHRELFLSRQVETLPATHIRGKCTVTLLNETESLLSYLNKDDTFFYSLVYDPQQKTLLADKGEIRVGSRYQAEITHLLKDEEEDGRNLEDLETLIWTPGHSLTDRQIDQFLVIARSVGTFARALDCSSSVKQPSLHMSAAAASRDITLFHAMDTIHKHTYSIAEAISSLVPSTGPVLCRDEMEEWSASEANLFEEALEKYGKDFNDIRQDFLPWKSLKNIIEYYYMWKTTDRYVQQKRVKAVEAESKLKQVYIPNYNKPNPAAISNNKPGMMNGANSTETQTVSGKPCESCYNHSFNVQNNLLQPSATAFVFTLDIYQIQGVPNKPQFDTYQSSQWYAWGPAHMQCRLCSTCWNYWKKYGGLKMPTRIEPQCWTRDNEGLRVVFDSAERLAAHMASHRPHRCTISGCGKEFKLKAHLARHCATAHGLAIRAGSPRPIVKTRAAFYLCTPPLTRIARRLCHEHLRPRHAARNPFQPVNAVAVKQECQTKTQGRTTDDLKIYLKTKEKPRTKVVEVSHRLGMESKNTPEWLIPTEKSKLPQPEHLAFPPPPRGEDGHYIIDPIYSREREFEKQSPSINNVSPTILRKRNYEEQNGPAAKRPLRPITGVIKPNPEIFSPNLLTRSSVINHLNGRSKMATVNKLGRKQVISWVDAPDDVYFQATEATRKLRKQLTPAELRKAARRPWRKLNVKTPASATDPEPIVILD